MKGPLGDATDLPPQRRRLPHRRRAETVGLPVGNVVLSATIGFDEAGRPAELFLSGAKDGSGLAAILEPPRLGLATTTAFPAIRAHARETREERKADFPTDTRAREESRPSAGPKAWTTSSGLLLGAPPAHVLGHHGVITDLQLGVVHRPETF
jgi:hypothetical protein